MHHRAWTFTWVCRSGCCPSTSGGTEISDARRCPVIRHSDQNGAVLLIDAANVVGSRPTGWWRDRAGAARTFVDQVRAAVDSGRLAQPVILVLEGQARGGVPDGTAHGVTVLHATGSGDDMLIDVASSASMNWSHSSRRIAAYGGGLRPWGPTWLDRARSLTSSSNELNTARCAATCRAATFRPYAVPGPEGAHSCRGRRAVTLDPTVSERRDRGTPRPVGAGRGLIGRTLGSSRLPRGVGPTLRDMTPSSRRPHANVNGPSRSS